MELLPQSNLYYLQMMTTQQHKFVLPNVKQTSYKNGDKKPIH